MRHALSFSLFFSLAVHGVAIFFLSSLDSRPRFPDGGVLPLRLEIRFIAASAKQETGDGVPSSADPLPPRLLQPLSEPGPEQPALLLPQKYFKWNELTERPVPLAEIRLEAEIFDDMAGAGKSRLRLFLDEKGGVSEIEVLENGLPDLYLAHIKEVFGKSRFKPGSIQGVPVKSQMLIEVEAR